MPGTGRKSGEDKRPCRVVAALSGGVDSSVAAALLKEAGHEVIGVTLQLHPCEQSTAARSCCGIEAVAKARDVAGTLGIPHFVVNYEKEFQEEVLRPSWEEYKRGRTPNPCILCNERIKFGRLLEKAASLGAQKVATGHYAQIDESGPFISRGVDPGKDQSYFLASLGFGEIRRLAFPVGGYLKTEVRELARRIGLSVAERPDSQDACLVSEGETFAQMLQRRFGDVQNGGPVVGDDGAILGTHNGVSEFTIGQRKGLGVAAGKPAWVRAIDADKATVYVTTDRDAILARGLQASSVRWVKGEPVDKSFECEVQVRYRQKPVRAAVAIEGGGKAKVSFVKPVRAVTPGQAVVFYEGDRVIGSGWIDGPV
jgi:tRNA-specific 2-thiouridylase